MTRTPAWLAAAALLMPGCGSGDRKAQTEVEYNCPANALEIEALQKEIGAFQAESGIRIRLNPFSGQDKLYAMMAAGKAPDIFYTNSTMRDRLAAEGRILDLRTLSRGDSLPGRLWPDVIRNGTSADGGWYSLGNWEFTCGVYYRKDLFTEEGLRAPDSSWTWDDMVRLARRLTRAPEPDGKGGRYGIFIGSHFVEALELMNGARFPREMLLLNIPAESALVYRRYLALMDEGIMPDLLRIQAMGMQPAQLLQNGRVAMLVEAVPNQSLIEAVTEPWGVAPLPRTPGREPAYFRSSSGGLSISASSADPEAAWKALKWIVTGASTYQPTPVLRDIDFAGGWETRYPQLRGSGFRTVWDLSLERNGGDPRYFVRFSSWTSGLILGRLQPVLDQVWARKISVDSLLAAVPGINREVRRELSGTAATATMKPEFRKRVEQALREMDDHPSL
ncbi:MAG TPA: extracellular solute-binding protein [Bacteroidota bacterium]|nr:extracellular solute-binding protein [Bacteroidota bacterium]